MPTISRLEPLPEKLQELSSPPKSLFYIGQPEFLNRKCVAILGSRRPYGSYTKVIVTRLASLLSKSGVTVISGGAMGVDAIAHQGSLPDTAYVGASSLDIIYPKTNQSLIEKIYAQGLALSEREKGFKPFRHSFIERNRIIVALADAVVIAQADLRSGSMASARLALELGRPLYVLPHRLGESEGTWQLIRKGQAQVIHDLDGFVSQYGDVIKKENDLLLKFCQSTPRVEEALLHFGDQLYEYELEGKVVIENGLVRPA